MINPINYSNQFLREVYAELRQTSWLKRPEVIDYTILIIVVSIAVGIYLGLLDIFFGWIIKSIF